MAIIVASKFETDASQSTYSFASRTPNGSNAQLVVVFWFRAGSTPNVTMSGCNLTWTKIAEQIEATYDTYGIALFKGVGTPATGVATVSFQTAPYRAAGVWLEMDDADISDPVQQYATAVTEGSGSLTVTLPSSPTTTVLGAFNAKWMPSPGSGFSQVETISVGTSWDQIRGLIETSTADQTIDATFDYSGCSAIGWEKKSAAPPQGQPRWARGYGIPTEAGWRRSSWN